MTRIRAPHSKPAITGIPTKTQKGRSCPSSPELPGDVVVGCSDVVVGCTDAVTEKVLVICPDIVGVPCIVLWAKELLLVAVTEMLGGCVDKDDW